MSADHFLSTYEELSRAKPSGLRGRMRGFALDLLGLKSAIAGDDRHLKTPRVQFLYLHHVFSDETYSLEKLIRNLGRGHSFIGYSEAVERIRKGNIDKPYICFSSDDGMRNNLQAAEIFQKNGISACFFLNPSVIGETDTAKIAQHCREKLHIPPVEFLNWKEVETIQKMGHEIGSHTYSHIKISASDAATISEELSSAKSVIELYCGAVKHFAFPYGRFFHFSETGRKAVFETGYESCASAERGCHVNSGAEIPKEELCIRRDHLLLNWSPAHIFYFLSRAAKHASRADNFFPALMP